MLQVCYGPERWLGKERSEGILQSITGRLSTECPIILSRSAVISIQAEWASNVRHTVVGIYKRKKVRS